jgi:hypothetical protein
MIGASIKLLIRDAPGPMSDAQVLEALHEKLDGLQLVIQTSTGDEYITLQVFNVEGTD